MLKRISLAPALALAAVLAWSAFLVSSQPVRSPWWTYADADATYTSTALNLTHDNSRAFYLDHPGLPLHELLATSFLVERLVRRDSDDAFFEQKMLDLDSTRPLFRGWAIAFYLAGALLSFLLVARLLGHWTWGLAAGLLWPAAPGLLAMSIQYRPDVPLSVLTLAVGYALARGAQLRSAEHYLAAALLLGFAVTVKMHAAGLVAPLVLAALWRPPRPEWRDRLRALLRRQKALVATGVFAWLVLMVTFNAPRIPFTPTAEQLTLVTVGVGLLALLLAFDRFYAALFAAIAAGIAIPGAILLQDGLQMLVAVARGLTGGGVNKDVEPFSASLQHFRGPLREVGVLLLLAAAAAVLGVVRRQPMPVLLFAGAAVLTVMAQARLGTTHYFAPAFVLSVPAALWLFRSRGEGASILVWPLVALIVFPTYRYREGNADAATSFAAREAPALRAVEQRLQAGEVGLVPGSWPHPDSRYFESVRLYAEHTPDYEYRFLPDYPPALAFAAERGLRPRYFVGPLAATVTGTMPLQLTTGTYTARPLPGVPGAVELVGGPSP